MPVYLKVDWASALRVGGGTPVPSPSLQPCTANINSSPPPSIIIIIVPTPLPVHSAPPLLQTLDPPLHGHNYLACVFLCRSKIKLISYHLIIRFIWSSIMNCSVTFMCVRETVLYPCLVQILLLLESFIASHKCIIICFCCCYCFVLCITVRL